MLTLDKIYHAAFVLKDVIRRTELVPAPNVNKKATIFLKPENLQLTVQERAEFFKGGPRYHLPTSYLLEHCLAHNLFFPDSVGVVARFFENRNHIHLITHRHCSHLLHYTVIITRITPISSVNITHNLSVMFVNYANCITLVLGVL